MINSLLSFFCSRVSFRALNCSWLLLYRSTGCYTLDMIRLAPFSSSNNSDWNAYELCAFKGGEISFNFSLLSTCWTYFWSFSRSTISLATYFLYPELLDSIISLPPKDLNSWRTRCPEFYTFLRISSLIVTFSFSSSLFLSKSFWVSSNNY